MEKSLKDKAINIKGKQYVLVSDRVLYFNDAYKNGCIQTTKLDAEDRVEFKATIYPDVTEPLRFFTGHSQAIWGDGYINKTSAMENAETSAVGRALALMGIGVIDSIASVDEINKANLKTSTQVNSKPLKTIIVNKSNITEPTCSVCGSIGLPSKFGKGSYCPNYRTCGKDTIIEPDTRTEAEKKISDELDAIPDIIDPDTGEIIK